MLSTLKAAATVAAACALALGSSAPALASNPNRSCFDDAGTTICFSGHSVFKTVEQPNGVFIAINNFSYQTTATVDGVTTVLESGTNHEQTAVTGGQLRESHDFFTASHVLPDGTTCTDTGTYHFAAGRIVVDEENITCPPEAEG
jgi:hypothetical protein